MAFCNSFLSKIYSKIKFTVPTYKKKLKSYRRIEKKSEMTHSKSFKIQQIIQSVSSKKRLETRKVKGAQLPPCTTPISSTYFQSMLYVPHCYVFQYTLYTLCILSNTLYRGVLIDTFRSFFLRFRTNSMAGFCIRFQYCETHSDREVGHWDLSFYDAQLIGYSV